MALLSDLFGLNGQPVPQAFPQESPTDELMRRALELNKNNPVISTPETITAAPPAWTPTVTPAAPPPAPVQQQAAPIQTAAAPPRPPVQVNASPSGMDRFSAFANGISRGGILTGIADAMGGVDKSMQTQNATASLLAQKLNLPPEQALAVARNPEMVQALIPQLFGPKDNTLIIPEGGTLATKDGRVLLAGSPKGSDLERQYGFYIKDQQARGLPVKSFEEWNLQNKSAGATKLTLDQRQPAAYQDKIGENLAKQHAELIESGRNAASEIGNVQFLLEAAKGFTPGLGAEWRRQFGPLLEQVGIKVDGLSDIQAFDALQNRMIQTIQNMAKGVQTEGDAQRFARSALQLSNTEEGNRVIAETMQATARVKQMARDIALRGSVPTTDPDYLTPTQVEREIAKLPNPFEEYKRWEAANRNKPAAPAAQSPARGAGRFAAPEGTADGWRSVAPNVRIRPLP